MVTIFKEVVSLDKTDHQNDCEAVLITEMNNKGNNIYFYYHAVGE